MSGMRAPSRLKDVLIWIGFAGAIVIVTAPVWQRLAFGFDRPLVGGHFHGSLNRGHSSTDVGFSKSTQ